MDISSIFDTIIFILSHIKSWTIRIIYYDQFHNYYFFGIIIFVKAKPVSTIETLAFQFRRAHLIERKLPFYVHAMPDAQRDE